ncbi:MAG: hypothetical protein ABSE08_16005 [Syntrophobacteraceae bacterium]
MGKVFGLKPVLQNILAMKAAILLITLPLPITSLAVLNVVMSDRKFKRSLKLIKPNASPTTLPRMFG